MQKQLEDIEVELSHRIYKLFLKKFNGNKSAFARASNCTEGTVRRVFKNEQGITINLLLRFCCALGVEASDLVKGLKINSPDY